MKLEKANVTIKFEEPILGSSPKDKDLYADYIASKIAKRKDLSEEERENIKADEIDAAYNDIEAVEGRGWTGFMRDELGLYVMNYNVRGYLKSALAALQENGVVKKIPAYKSAVDKFVHVRPRKLHFLGDTGRIIEGDSRNITVLERPLRAMTMKGPRVSLARSDCLPAGTLLSWEFHLLKNTKISMEMLKSAMEFGEYEGLGQWRSGGYGQFSVVTFQEFE